MKFDFVIGNPPYQEENKNNGRQSPVYNLFMENAYKISDCVEMITPARFLFNAGQTPKSWNAERLNDEHFKVLTYVPNASEIFPTTDIKGGVAITLRNANKNYGALKVFTQFNELNDIVKKVIKSHNAYFLDTIISPRGCYHTTDLFFEDYPSASSRLGKGTKNMLASNFFEKIHEVYCTEKPINSDNYYVILSRVNNKRELCYIKKDYVEENKFLVKFNVAYPKSSGRGDFGEILPSTEILYPYEGATDTFINIGILDSLYEAESLQKYLKTKFLRTLLGVKKVTQDNPRSVWDMIPIQDFNKTSDINWEQSISNIDKQLYKKYNLSQDEIDFIENNVKEME